eukprot:1510005-Rhodomonas_salina.1
MCKGARGGAGRGYSRMAAWMVANQNGTHSPCKSRGRSATAPLGVARRTQRAASSEAARRRTVSSAAGVA